jgi:hypothetical protein
MASPAVAELAHRMQGALWETTSPIERRDVFVNYYPVWFQARDMYDVLMDAMRVELGLPSTGRSTFPRAADWPWLSDRPSRESYRQNDSTRKDAERLDQRTLLRHLDREKASSESRYRQPHRRKYIKRLVKRGDQ